MQQLSAAAEPRPGERTAVGKTLGDCPPRKVAVPAGEAKHLILSWGT